MQCHTLRLFGDSTCFAVVTDPQNAQAYIEQGRKHPSNCSNLGLVPFETNASIRGAHERYNVDVMLSLLDITPFHETIFMDSDVLRAQPCDLWHSELPRHHNQSVTVLGRNHDCTWHFGHICEIEKRNELRLPHTHAGMMFLRKDAAAAEFFAHAKTAAKLYWQLGFRPFKQNGRALEPHWSYAFGKMDWVPIEFGVQLLLGFEWRPGEAVPPTLLRAAGGPEPHIGSYCHAHMFNEAAHAALYRTLVATTAGSSVPSANANAQGVQARHRLRGDAASSRRLQAAELGVGGDFYISAELARTKMQKNIFVLWDGPASTRTYVECREKGLSELASAQSILELYDTQLQ